ncbi:MAG: HYR domain-containing protein [Crocinitomicaceae bacterium]|nr:HYR domain-containing protein [Flavobacteriales bacterium]NQZ37413.1 HYR domain-containing protein [Crocinitomicaceae bacterium]
MIKLLLCSLFLLASTQLFSQATLFTELFESGSASWVASGDLTENKWTTSTCAGNGPTYPGANSIYVSPAGGTIAGCDAGEVQEFAYANAPATTIHSLIISTTVDATCASALQLSFDYSMGGVIGQDYAELIYSTDGGTTWIAIGSEFTISAWTNSTLALPAILDGTSFELGFRFTYNDATITGTPLSIDNVLVTGTDIVPPVFNCFSPINLAVLGACQAIAEDYTKTGFTVLDNCTDSINIIITQDIPEFTVLASGPGGTEIITLTATDESGNSTQCSFTLNIIDATPPVPVCPGDTSVYVDNNCDGLLPDYTSFVVSTDNCSSAINITTTQSPLPGTIINGAIVVTPIIMTATDESGNSSTCTFDMRTLDTIPTSITCPIDTNLAVATDCLFTLGDYTAGAILVDNCEPLSNLTVTQSPIPGTIVSAHQVITLTVNGGVPLLPQSCTFNGWLIDTIAPAIICPTGTSTYVNFACTTTLTDFTGSGAVTENCSTPVTVTQFPLVGTVIGSNPIETITLTVSDSAGNSSSCQFFLAVIDTISPTVACPLDQQELANASCQGILGNYTSLATPSDNCSTPANITVTQSPAPGTVFSGIQVVTLTAEDESSNTGSCSFNVTIDDQVNPTISCPPAQSVATTTSCDYLLTDFTGSASGFDNCTPFGMLTYTQSPIASTLLPTGINPITLNVQDAAGNTSSCSFNLTVIDQTEPIFNVCPSTQTEVVDATCSAILDDYTLLATVSDNCSSGVGITVTQSPISGTSITSTTLVTLTATDQAGNTNICIFNVIPNDTMNPVIICPASQTAAINASCSYSIPDFTGLVGGTDNCSSLANMTVSQNPTIGSTASGITPVLITLTDENGNSTTCISSVLPDDITPPTITCPTSSTASAGTACDLALTNFGALVTVTDNCSGYTLSQSPAVGALVPVGTNLITITVTDAGGNSTSCDFELFVSETESPIITCPNDTISCDPVVFYNLPTFTDNCLAGLVQTDGTGYTVGSTFPIGITDLSYQAIDTSGNSAGCNFRVEILEYPSNAIIALDTIELCSTSTSVLQADAATTGTGEWTVSSGQGNFNNQFANVTGVNNVDFGTNLYTWTISTAACGSLSDSIIVIRNEAPFPTSIAADTIYSCSDSIINLQAVAATVGNGIWTVSPQTTINDPSVNVTSATVLIDGWYEFTWTVTNGSCPQTSDSVAVYYSMSETNASSSDSAICIENGAVQLSANSLLAEQFSYWSFISGGGSIDDIYSTQTEVTNLQNGVNSIVYEVSNPNCPTQSDTVIIIVSVCNGFDPIFPTVITPNFDGRNDLFVIEYLELIYPDCHVTIFNRWGSVVFESVGYADPWDGTNQGEVLPLGTYFYKIELNDADGTLYSGDISIIR